MPFNRTAFEEILSRELIVLGLTPSAWAKQHGISPGTLHEIRFPRAGRTRKPSPAMMLKLSDALGIPVGALNNDGSVEASA